MSWLLSKLRLYWWKRSYSKIWSKSIFINRPTFSTDNEDEASELALFLNKNIAPEKDWVVLDMGCGNGKLGEAVFRNCKMLIQADWSFNALTMAQMKSFPPKRYMLQADAGNPPLKYNSFDCIFMYSLLHNSGSIGNARRRISLAISLLKDGGRIYIGDVPLKNKLYREFRRRIKNIRSVEQIKYFFAEFMQISFSLDDFLDFSEAERFKIIPQPAYLKFHRWRMDIEIQKEVE